MIEEKTFVSPFNRYFISTDPDLNQPTMVYCDRCRRLFQKGPWSDAYSLTGRAGITILCPDCAKQALADGKVRNLLY